MFLISSNNHNPMSTEQQQEEQEEEEVEEYIFCCEEDDPCINCKFNHVFQTIEYLELKMSVQHTKDSRSQKSVQVKLLDVVKEVDRLKSDDTTQTTIQKLHKEIKNNKSQLHDIIAKRVKKTTNVVSRQIKKLEKSNQSLMRKIEELDRRRQEFEEKYETLHQTFHSKLNTSQQVATALLTKTLKRALSKKTDDTEEAFLELKRKHKQIIKQLHVSEQKCADLEASQQATTLSLGQKFEKLQAEVLRTNSEHKEKIALLQKNVTSLCKPASSFYSLWGKPVFKY